MWRSRVPSQSSSDRNLAATVAAAASCARSRMRNTPSGTLRRFHRLHRKPMLQLQIDRKQRVELRPELGRDQLHVDLDVLVNLFHQKWAERRSRRLEDAGKCGPLQRRVDVGAGK